MEISKERTVVCERPAEDQSTNWLVQKVLSLDHPNKDGLHLKKEKGKDTKHALSSAQFCSKLLPPQYRHSFFRLTSLNGNWKDTDKGNRVSISEFLQVQSEVLHGTINNIVCGTGTKDSYLSIF